MRTYTYYGCIIEPYTGRTPYWRYQAKTPSGGVYGTSLEGIRYQIRADRDAYAYMWRR
jgi:hypothetical protein